MSVVVVSARDVMGLPMVSIASGEDVAEVRDVVYDGDVPISAQRALSGENLVLPAAATFRNVEGRPVVASDNPESIGSYALVVAEATSSYER